MVADPPERTERAWQDEPGQDEWQVEFFENEVRLSRIHMVARYWDYIPGRQDLPPGIRFEELDQVRVSKAGRELA